MIIISHTLSQIIDAGKIIVMEQGGHETVYDKSGTGKKRFDAMARSLNIDKIAKTMND